ncbi:DUF1566 domain-containing protein [bacterium]|nr:DUF1566 domain-containing protein [bacterium]
MKKFFIVFSIFCLFFLASCSVKDDDYDEIDLGDTGTDQPGSEDETPNPDTDTTDSDNSNTDNTDTNDSGTDTDRNDTETSDGDTPDNNDADDTEISDIDISDNDNNADDTEISDIDISDNDNNDSDTEISDIDISDNDNDADDIEISDGDTSDNNDTDDIEISDNDPNDQDNPEDQDSDTNEPDNDSDNDTDTDSGESGEVPECSNISTTTPCKAGGVIWSSRSGTAKEWNEADTDCKAWSEGRFTSGWELPQIDDLRNVMRNCSNTEPGGNCRVTNNCAFMGTDIDGNTCYSNPYCKKILGDHNVCSPSLEHSPFGETGKLWSTLTQDDPNWAWYVSFYNGEISWAPVSDEIYYRCVHAVE